MSEFETKPCERCETTSGDFGLYNPMCGEIQLGFGIIGWLCVDCRLDWSRFMCRHPLWKPYSKAVFRLDAWKARISATGDGNVDDGIRLWEELEEYELKLTNITLAWLDQKKVPERGDGDGW